MANRTTLIVVAVIFVLILVGLGVGLGLFFGLRNRNPTGDTNPTGSTNPLIQQTSPNFGMIQSTIVPVGQKLALKATSGTAAFSYTNYWTFSVQIPSVNYPFQVSAIVGSNNVTGTLNGSTNSTTVVNAAEQVYLPNVNNTTGGLALFYWSALPSSQIVSINIPVKERTNKASASALVDPVNLVTLVPFTVYYLAVS